MRVILEDGETRGISEEPVVEFHDVVRLFRQAAMAFGFQPQTVNEYFADIDDIGWEHE